MRAHITATPWKKHEFRLSALENPLLKIGGSKKNPNVQEERPTRQVAVADTSNGKNRRMGKEMSPLSPLPSVALLVPFFIATAFLRTRGYHYEENGHARCICERSASEPSSKRRSPSIIKSISLFASTSTLHCIAHAHQSQRKQL